MSSIFDEAQYKMQAKRGDRLKKAQKKAKPPYAIYQGRDSVDGTDIIQTGANDPVSGFRLISNAPMAIGDRVAARPNKVSLARADARNVAPPNNALELNLLLINHALSFVIGIPTDFGVTEISLPLDPEIQGITIGRFLTSANLRFLDVPPTAFQSGFVSFLDQGSNKKFEYDTLSLEYIFQISHDGIFIANEQVITQLGFRGIRLRLTINTEIYDYSFNFGRGASSGFLSDQFICDCEQLIDIIDADTLFPTVIDISYSYLLF